MAKSSTVLLKSNSSSGKNKLSIILMIFLFVIFSLQSQDAWAQNQQCFDSGSSCQGTCYINCLSQQQVVLQDDIQNCLYNSSVISTDLSMGQHINIIFLTDINNNNELTICSIKNIQIQGNDSTQVIVQSMKIINGTLQNQSQQQNTDNLMYSNVGNMTLQLTNINSVTLQNLGFFSQQNVQQDLINIQNCRNITISYCNFNNISFVQSLNNVSYQIITITESENSYQVSQYQDFIEILYNQFQFISSLGSVLHLNNNSQSQIQIQNNQFSQNKQQLTSVIFITSTTSNYISITSNVFYQNTLFQNNGTAISIYNSMSQIQFSNNVYTFNQALNGNGGCVYIANALSNITFNNESHLSNAAQQIGSSAGSGNGGSTYFYQTMSQIEVNSNYYYNNSASNQGGSIYLDTTYGSIQLQNSTFIKNSALSGGSILIYQSINDINISSSSFTNNLVSQNGGSISISYCYGNLTFYQSNFTSNTANTGGAFFIYYTYGQLLFNEDSFSQNTAYDSGSVYIQQSQNGIYLNNCQHSNNSATNNGGAVFITNNSGIVLFTENDFNFNSAAYGGGLYIIQNSGIVQMDSSNSTSNTALGGGFLYLIYSNNIIYFQSCTHTNNSGSDYGGAFFISQPYSFINIIQNIFNINTSPTGGAIIIDQSYNQIVLDTCNFFNNSASSNGGALFIQLNTGYIQLININFTQNQAILQGGAALTYQTSGEISFQYCYFSTNSGFQLAGAIAIVEQESNTISVTNNQFFNNFAVSGGAVLLSYIYGNLIFQSNLYQSNQATNEGGAIYVQENDYTIMFYNETFLFNYAAHLGGAIFSIDLGDTFLLQNSSFFQNGAINGAAVYFTYMEYGIQILNNTFDSNIAAVSGGAVYIQNGITLMQLENNNFVNNIAYVDGGVIFQQFQLQGVSIISCNFSNNQAYFSGGALALYQVYSIQINNCIFSFNSAIIGGALSIQQPQDNVILYNNQFYGNKANQYGGAVTMIGQSNLQVAVFISQSKFSNNVATNQGGGDIYIMIFTNVSLQQNQHYFSQGQQGGSINIYNVSIFNQFQTLFLNSIAVQKGSAMYIDTIDTLNLTNALFSNCLSSQATLYIIQTNLIYLGDIEISENSVSDQVGGLQVQQAIDLVVQNLTVYLNYAQNDAGGIMLLNITSLIITNLNCYQNTAKQGNGGCMYISDPQNIQLEGNQTYTNNQAGSYGGAMYIYNPYTNNLILSMIGISQNTAYQGGGIAIVNNNNLLIKLTSMQFTNNIAQYQGGAFYLSAQLNSQSIISNDFQAFQYFGVSQNYSQLYILDCQFVSNSGIYGGAVAIIQNQLASIINSYFKQNQAIADTLSSSSSQNSQGGGAIYIIDVAYISTSNSMFHQNSAQKGGAYYQTQTQADSQITQVISIFNSSFSLNNAVADGGAIDIEYVEQRITIQYCNFTQNRAQIAGALIITIIQIQSIARMLMESTNSTQIQIISNNFIGNLATNNAQYSQSIRIVAGQVINQSQSTDFTTNLLNKNSFDSTENSISLGCQPGEQQDLTTYLCSPCTIALYSQGGYGSQCTACPVNAECLGNYSYLKVNPGYWRANQSSLAITYCINTYDQCLGGEQCQSGYTGILCEECDYANGYARSAPFTCGLCENSAKVWFVAIFGIIFTTACVLVVVYGNISYRNEQLHNIFTKSICNYFIMDQDNTPALTRTLISHSQILTILFSIDVQYPKQLVKFYSYFGQYTQVTTFSFICAFGVPSGLHPAYMNVIFNHVSAFFSFLLLMAILIVLDQKKILVFRQQAKAFTLNLLIFLLPGMINQLLPLLSQRSVDTINDKTFTEQELGIVWGSKQFENSYKIILPLLFFWLFIFAWVVYVIFTRGKQLFLNRKDQSSFQESNKNFKIKDSYPISQRSKTIYNYGNLFIGYTEERYYWEAVSMAAKIGLIVIQNLFAYDPIVVTSFSTLIVVIVIALQFEKSPYNNSTIRRLSSFCLIIQILSIQLIQIMYTEPNRLGLFYFSFVILVTTNYTMVLIILRFFIKDKYSSIQPFLQNLLLNKRKIKQWIDKHDWFYNSSFYQQLMKQKIRDQKVSYAWNIIKFACKMMTQYVKLNNTLMSPNTGTNKGQLIEKRLLVAETPQEDDDGYIIAQKNLKRDLLLKILFNDWKKNSSNQFYYRLYLRWRKIRGEQISQDVDNIITNTAFLKDRDEAYQKGLDIILEQQQDEKQKTSGEVILLENRFRNLGFKKYPIQQLNQVQFEEQKIKIAIKSIDSISESKFYTDYNIEQEDFNEPFVQTIPIKKEPKQNCKQKGQNLQNELK